MSYRRKHRGAYLAALLAIFLFTISIFVGIFWWNGRAYAKVSLEEKYYLLVRDCEDTTAAVVAGQIYSSGGAGYLLDTGDLVALACYFSERDAEFVQGVMAEKGLTTHVVEISPEDFSLNGKRAEERAHITANANTADTCARILYDTANGLERTELTQDEARAALTGVIKSLKGLREGNEGELYGLWNAALYEAEREGREVAAGILFAKDLRYIQIRLCLAISNIENYFS